MTADHKNLSSLEPHKITKGFKEKKKNQDNKDTHQTDVPQRSAVRPHCLPGLGNAVASHYRIQSGDSLFFFFTWQLSPGRLTSLGLSGAALQALHS